ncbi:MAG: Holliday junction resolvase RuvX [Defluviitaleaceae bacterium]|nr:Holliday junction resolvase RuvX [Defluviitaleaceae bacterium]
MRTLSIDFGDRSVGLAISDELGITARGLNSIIRKPTEKKWAFINQIKEIVDRENILRIVVGYPIRTDTKISEQTNKTLEFKDKLQNALPLQDIYLRDERFTSVIAERVLAEGGVPRHKRGEHVDKLAAVIILQDFLDEKARDIKTKGENTKMNDDMIIKITDEDGVEIEFVVLDELTHNCIRYMLVVETDLIDDDEAEAVIFKEVGSDADNMVFEELDDDEFETVAALFDERLDDYEVEF